VEVGFFLGRGLRDDKRQHRVSSRSTAMPSASVPDPLPDSLSTQAYLRGFPGVPRFIFPANGYAPPVRQTAVHLGGREEKFDDCHAATKFLPVQPPSPAWAGSLHHHRALAGWIASRIMKTREGLLLDIVLVWSAR